MNEAADTILVEFKQQKKARSTCMIDGSQAVLNAGCRPLDHQDHRIRRKAQSFIHRWKLVCIQYMMSMLVSGPDKAGLHVSISKN